MKVVLDDGIVKEIDVDKALIEDVLNKLNINPVEVIVSKNGKITSEYDEVGPVDHIKIIRIIHGG